MRACMELRTGGLDVDDKGALFLARCAWQGP